MQAQAQKSVPTKKRARVIEPKSIHAEVEPVQAYAKETAALKKSAFHVVTIPDGSRAHLMGYRFVSIPAEELEYYLANGATEVKE